MAANGDVVDHDWLEGLEGRSSSRALAYVGRCAVCSFGASDLTVYVERGSWARDHLLCVRCRSIPRERCLALVLMRARPRWPELRIHESSPSDRGVSRALARHGQDYSSSQFLDGVPRGGTRGGVRCEDLHELAFADASLDVFVTQDVMEHVMHPRRVLREIRRVLAPGGLFLATFPWNPDLRRSRPRAVESEGSIAHLLEPQFHGNPVGDGRSLVTWDWGADIFDVAESEDFDLEIVKVPHHRRHGIDGEYRGVFLFTPSRFR